MASSRADRGVGVRRLATGLAAGGTVAAGAAGVGLSHPVARRLRVALPPLPVAARRWRRVLPPTASARQVRAARRCRFRMGAVIGAGAQVAVSPLRRAASKAADSLKQSFQSGARAVAPASDASSIAGAGGSATPAPGRTDAAAASASSPSAEAGTPRLGQAHEALAADVPWRPGRRPCRARRRQPWRLAPPSHSKRSADDLQTRLDPLRQDAGTQTPYQRAAQVWDDRIGSARVQARNWRLMAFGCLILLAGFAAARSGNRRAEPVMPWVVEIEQARPGANRRAGDRGLSPDRSADRLASRPLHRAGACRPGRRRGAAPELAAAYEFTSDRGAAALNDHARVERSRSPSVGQDSRSRSRCSRRDPGVALTASASPAAERRSRDRASSPPRERWSAIVTLVGRAATRRRAPAREPARHLVNAINSSRSWGNDGFP